MKGPAPGPRCLYALIRADHERHEAIVRDVIGPVVGALRRRPELESLFFGRFNVPEWEVRLRVVGDPAWLHGPVRDLIRGRVDPLVARGAAAGCDFATYQREVERYGGEEGMRLAERVFHLDSLACLDLMEAEREGLCGRSRREVSLVLTERTLDLMGFDAGARLRFYRHGYQWALDKGTWTAEDLPVLDEKYAALRPGLASLFSEAGTERPDALWGGEAPARIAERFVADLRPVVEALLAAHAAGRIRQDIVDLAWAFTHMQCNRLGIGPVAEAILRYFMHRFAVEEAAAGA